MDLQRLHGQWFIHFTNFPMWLKGDKTNPAITYGAGKTPRSMSDVVTYQKSGKERSIRGVDSQLEDQQFRWRGSGLLFFVTSDWKIDHLSTDGQWMIIRFKKSYFTPAGNDILCRSPMIDAAQAEDMLQTFERLYPGQALARVYHDLPALRHHEDKL